MVNLLLCLRNVLEIQTNVEGKEVKLNAVSVTAAMTYSMLRLKILRIFVSKS